MSRPILRLKGKPAPTQKPAKQRPCDQDRKTKGERQRDEEAVLLRLAKLFPHTFRCIRPPAPAPWQPLALGIDTALLKLTPRPAGRKVLKRALKRYTKHPYYLMGMVEGAARIGLDGEPCGIVEPSHAAFAAERFSPWLDEPKRKAPTDRSRGAKGEFHVRNDSTAEQFR